MKNYVDSFPKQINEALAIAGSAKLGIHPNVANVLIIGLGGSGIGGTLLAELIGGLCKVPVLVNKDYHIPEFVGKDTLVIVSSYSGNTEETLQALAEAMAKKAHIACITSGGKVLEIASENEFDVIQVPGGNPPRTCLGYSLIQLFAIMEANRLIEPGWQKDFSMAEQLILADKPSIQKEANDIAEKIYNKIPVIYSLGATEGIAIRFRQQLNENGKMLCWHHVIPEMNHNELVGWASAQNDKAVIILNTTFDDPRNIRRKNICKEVFQKYCSTLIEISAKGQSKIEQAIYLIHLTDWVSCYVADLRNVDPIEVNIIDFLKKELAAS